MPAALIPAVLAAGGAYAFGSAAALGLALGVSTFTGALIIGASTFALNTLGSLMAPKPKLNTGGGNTGSQVQTQQFKQAVAYRQIIYGEVQTSGEIIFFGNSSDSGIYTDATPGNTKYMHLVIVLATHECDAIDTVYFGTDPIYNSDIGNQPGSTSPATPVVQLAGLGSGNLSNGWYEYATTFVTAAGESLPSSVSTSVRMTSHGTNGQIEVDSIQVGPAGVTARKLYRTQAAIAQQELGDLQLVATISDNTTTTYVDNIADASLGALPPTSDSTGLSSGSGGYVISGKYANVARIKKHLGGPGQVVDPDLLNEMGAAGITSSFIGNGNTYLYVRLTASPTLFQGGAPAISACVRGKKVYDPRSSTTVWNPNPALCLRDYAQDTVYGKSIDATRIPDSFVNAAANSNEEIVNTLAVAQPISSVSAAADAITLNTALCPFQTGDRVQISSDASVPSGLSAGVNYYIIIISLTGTVKVQLASTYANALQKTAINITSAGSGHMTLTKNGEPRYTANGVLNTGMIPADIINNLLSAMAGDFIMVGGQWQMKSGVYVAPDVTLTEKDCHGPLSTQTKQTRRERFNQVQGLYTSPLNYGQTTTYPLVTDSTFVVEDNNKPVLAQLDLPLTSRAQTAQRIARIQLNRNRRQRTVQFTGSLAALQIQATGTFSLSHINYFSGALKIYEVSDFSLVPRKTGNALALTFDIIAHQTDAGVYTFDETTQEILPSAPLSAPISKGDLPAKPGAPNITETLYSTIGSSGLKDKAIITWAASPDQLVRQYQVEYKLTSDMNYTVLPLTQDTTVTIFDVAPGEYNFRVKGITLFTKETDYADTTQTLLGLSARPADISNFSVVSLSNDATLSWDAASDLDVSQGGYIRLRHTPDIVTPSWGSARDICAQLPGITTQVHVPLIVGTYMAKFVDSTGNESLTAAMIVINDTQIFNLNAVATSQEDTVFLGAKTNMVAVDNVLRLDGVGLFDSGAGNLDAAIGNFDQGGGSGNQVSGSYVFQSPKIDAGGVAKCWVTTSIALIIYNSLNLFDLQAGNFDDATGLFDGTEITGITVQMFIRTTNDDPNGSPAWSAWMPFVAGYFTARGFDFKLEVVSQDAAYQIDITSLAATVDVPDVIDSGLANLPDTGPSTVDFNKSYTQPPHVVGIINGAQEGDQLILDTSDVTTSNFLAAVVNSGVYVSRIITWYAKGY